MILKILIISFFGQFLKSLEAQSKLNTNLRVTYITLCRVSKHTRKLIGHDNVNGQDEPQWEVVLVAAGLVQVLHNFDRTLAALVAPGNVDWRFICFPVGFQAFETCWVFIQNSRQFIKIFSAKQLAAEPMVGPWVRNE